MKKYQDNSAPCKTAAVSAKYIILRRIKESFPWHDSYLVIVEQKHPVDNAHLQVGYWWMR